MRKLISIILLLGLPLLVMSDDVMVVGNKLIRTGGSVIVARETIPWTPAFTTTVAWYDASDASTITESSGNVSQWDDKSGNGYDMRQSSGSQQPNYVTNAINGLASLYYSSTLDQMYTNLATGVDVTNLVMIAVGMGALGDWPAYGYVKSTDGTDALDHRHQTGVTSGKINPSVKIDGVSASPATINSADLAEYVPCISVVYYDGTKTVSRANGGAQTAENTGAPDGATFTIDRIQCGRQSNTPKNYQGEYIILDTADLATIQKIEGYLAWKWGTQSKLPAGHPYKNKYPTVPVWTPKDLEVVAWYDASDASTVTTNLSGVTQWDDKSGNGNDVTQGTAGHQPAYSLTNFNGLPSLTFDGLDDRLASTLAQLTNKTVAVVIEPTGKGNNNNNTVLGATDSFNSGGFHIQAGQYSTGNPRFVSFAGGALPNERWNGDSVVNDVNPAVYEKGVGIVPCSGISTEGRDYYLGIWRDVSSSPDAYKGKIAEVIITDKSESLADQQRLEGYLAWKWGLEANLPITHPYKYHQPTE